MADSQFVGKNVIMRGSHVLHFIIKMQKKKSYCIPCYYYDPTRLFTVNIVNPNNFKVKTNQWYLWFNICYDE